MRFSALLHGSGSILAHAQCACKLLKAHARGGLDPAMHPFQSSCRPSTRSRSAGDDLRRRATRSFAMIAVSSLGWPRMLRYASVLAGCVLLSVIERAGAQSSSNPLMEGRGGDLFFPISCGAQ